MSHLLRTAGYLIDPIAGTVVAPDGQAIKVRPRTFEVLLLLLSEPSTSFSKSQILERVWPNVVVGEHVVFQSINEIRQAFAPVEVIRTIPKQGYHWIEFVEVQASEPAIVIESPSELSNSDHESNVKSSNLAPLRKRFTGQMQWLVAMSCLLIIVLFWANEQPETHVSGSIVVLPVKNNLQDNDHNWITYGAMDELIQLLASSDQSGVLPTDYVFEVMERADAAIQNYTPEDIKQVFVVSGANLIVETAISGTPQAYEILYTLHRRNSSTKGIIFTQNVSLGIKQFAALVSKKSGLVLNDLNENYRSDFTNELIANAIEAKNNMDVDSAKHMLSAATSSEPDNLVAKRLLLQLAVEQGEFDISNPLAADLEQYVSKQPQIRRDFVAVMLWMAINQLQQHEFELAEQSLSKTELWAEQLNEWLYLAYVEEIRGQLAQYNKQYEQAEQHYQNAIRFHQVLQCPNGESNGLLNLSMLAKDAGNSQLAVSLAHDAMNLIKQRQLSKLEETAADWINKLE